MKTTCTYLLLLCALFCQAQAQLPRDVLDVIEKRIELGLNPSIAIGILDSTGTHYFNFGKTRKGGAPVDEHTIYEIGSVSKTFTALLLADAVLKGEVSLDDPVQKYLPKKVHMPRYEDQQITLGHLSDHTSSLPRMPDNFTPADEMNPYADYTPQQLFAFLDGYKLTRPVGSGFEYSNLAQGLLGYVLALRADTDYETLLHMRITAPLGMQETGVSLTPLMKAHMAYAHSEGMESSNWDLATLTGAGGIRSSVSDMLIYLKAQLGKLDTPLYPAMQLTQTPRHKLAGDEVGLGWFIGQGPHGKVISHSGQTGGYNSYVGFNRETGTAVVVLTNSDASTDDIGAHLMNPKMPMTPAQLHASTVLNTVIEEQGPEAVVDRYRELKKDSSAEYDFSEDMFNSLGYHYLRMRKTDAAVAIFKVNTLEHPESFNVWDSYAEGLMLSGDTTAAIENYQKSLEIHPGNTNAVVMLETMGVKTHREIVEVPVETLDTYLGEYALAPTFHIVVTREGSQLFVQATGQPRFDVFPSSQTEFYLTAVEARVNFNKDENGEVKSMTLFQGGQQMEAEKLKQ